MISRRTIRRPLLAAGALLAAASLSLAGCSAGSSSLDENAAKPQQLRMLYGDASAGDKAIASLVPALKEKYGIDLVIDNMPYDALQQKVFSEFASSSDYYDIVIVDTPWAPALVQGLEPLSPYLTNEALNPDSPESDLGDFIPKVFYDTAVYKADSPTERFTDPTAEPDIAAITDEGFDVFGLPIQANVATMAYRADLFDDPAQQAAFAAEYGRPLEVPTTWTTTRRSRSSSPSPTRGCTARRSWRASGTGRRMTSRPCSPPSAATARWSTRPASSPSTRRRVSTP